VITPKEARLLALERKQARIGEILRGLRMDVAGARQGIWDVWSDVGAVVVTPTPTPPPPLNHAPTINVIAGQTACATGASFNVSLAGITDGDSGTQVITITATSSSTGIIPNPTITYTSPNTTGTLTYTPVANSIATVTLTVKVVDNGGTAGGGVDTRTRAFTVTVRDPTQAPTLDPFPAFSGPWGLNYLFNMTGISSGAGQAPGTPGILTVSVTSSNAGVGNPNTISYSAPSTTGSFRISANAPGTATITVTVTDASVGRCGTSNTKVQTFVCTFT
jgi:hypothetical protein